MNNHFLSTCFNKNFPVRFCNLQSVIQIFENRDRRCRFFDDALRHDSNTVENDPILDYNSLV